jgi:hypothetical protein
MGYSAMLRETIKEVILLLTAALWDYLEDGCGCSYCG